MAFIIIMVVSLITSFLIVSALKSRAKTATDERIKNQGYAPEDLVYLGKYVAGHPDLDTSKSNIYLLPTDDNLDIVDGYTKKIAKIGKDQIKNVYVEDQSTIEKRISTGRLLTVGVLALAWQKKEKKELSYLTIDWNDGKFDHETLFEFGGFNSMEYANKARNSIIRFSR